MPSYFILLVVQNYTYEHNTRLEASDINSNGDSVQPSVKSELSPLVEARLDLPISRSMLDQNIKSPIIRRCWEDQFLHKSKR
jgi:hypothetical protein